MKSVRLIARLIAIIFILAALAVSFKESLVPPEFYYFGAGFAFVIGVAGVFDLLRHINVWAELIISFILAFIFATLVHYGIFWGKDPKYLQDALSFLSVTLAIITLVFQGEKISKQKQNKE